MLRNRSRAVTNNQALTSDYHSSLVSSPTTPTQNTTSIASSFLRSPRIFDGILAGRSLSDADNAKSPTSILDAKPFSNFVKPFGYDRNSSVKSHSSSLDNTGTNKHTYEKGGGVGLALVDSLNDEKYDANFSKPNSKMVLFGAKLKVGIPPLPSSAFSSAATPKSPADFGIKTRNSICLGSLSGLGGSPSSCIRGKDPPVELAEGLSLSEMELSEDYTCVITHGPSPKTTHIFHDCVLENCCGVVKLSDLEKDGGLLTDDPTSVPFNFLRDCNSCKDNLGDGKDIFMYRSEKGDCCHEMKRRIWR
ncbi:FCS-Like Zinc finger 8 [Coffea arabica]|uniref:FCS-Like Zinc finger 8 n=1 Tax=Coffea arabica TaxID=13443 RepID=A0A6P6UZU4_COFAR|nr:FCS-Like Zinc finger 8-like [Coffea arabica]